MQKDRHMLFGDDKLKMHEVCLASILAGCRLKGRSCLSGARDAQWVRIQVQIGGGVRFCVPGIRLKLWREGMNREWADRDEMSGRVEGDLLRRHVDRDSKRVACVRCTIRPFRFFELPT